MPISQIDVRCQHGPERETALLKAVHDSLIDAFKIPPADRTLRLVAHEPQRFWCDPGLAKPELYTLITIQVFAGRSRDAKRALYRGIVDRLEGLGIPRDHINVLLQEFPTENLGTRGGQAACDLDLGFKIEV